MPETKTLETLEIETAPHPAFSIIVLHGLGADGHDFVPICDELDLSSLGGVRFVFPHAPVMPVTLNGGYEMRAWYDIIPASNGGRVEDEAGLRQSQQAIDALIAREVARGTPASKIVLMGFSQGCAMTLMAGLRHPEALAALVCLSGYLPLPETTANERSSANQHTPIFLAHGTRDDVVVPARGLAARDQLKALGYGVQWHDYPMPHSVCPPESADINAWLLQVLAPKAA
jgi:phospholipase/carboxylesterase